jgi:hypothetical protein
MLQYNYSWGNEDVLGSWIEVVKGFMNDDDIYIVTFEQESDNYNLFSDINVLILLL